MSEKDDLSKLIAQVSKRLDGAASVTRITEAPNPYQVRRPTDVLELDEALAGGFPGGTIVQVFGPDGTGKDYLYNLTMAANQRKYGERSNMFWLSFGYRPDLQFMRMSGMQIAYTDDELRLRGIDPEEATPEQRGHTVGNIFFVDIAGEVKAATEKPAEVMMTAALQLIGSGKFQFGVINELGSGETKYDVKKGLDEDARMAAFASLMADFCRKFYTVMRIPNEDGSPNETTVGVVNPVRANTDTYTAKFNKFSQPNGYALKHAKAIDVHLKPGGTIREGGDKVGKIIKWKIAKGKHGISEGAEGEFKFYFNHGIDHMADLVNMGKASGHITRKGRYYYVLDSPEKIQGGGPGVADYLRDNQEIAETLRAAISAGAVDE